jgi:thiamine-phosphate pyrophosphorylase
MRGLYAIIDVEALEKRRLDPLSFAHAVLEARPAAIQIRDKLSGAKIVLELLRAVAPMATAAGVALFANDRPDLALIAGAYGVHVGQDDLAVDVSRALARAMGKPLAVGLSTHNSEQVDAAILGGVDPAEPSVPDYIAIGPIFVTSSKRKASPVVGIDQLARLATRTSNARPDLPVVAIGGITQENVAKVASLVASVAVIQALLPEREGPAAYVEVTERARALQTSIVRNRP